MRQSRSGVSLLVGPRERRYTLPIVSRCEITARPAYRPDDTPPSWFEVFDSWAWPRVGIALTVTVPGLVAVLIVVQLLRHFRPDLVP